MSLRDRRVDYETPGLDVSDLAIDPLLQWQRWYDAAVARDVPEPNAMNVATAAHGIPASRVVLARGADERGIVFFTNYDSAKSNEIKVEPRVALTFVWLDVLQQVRVVGVAEQLSDTENDDYFASRPRKSQISAWASPQSQEIPDRNTLIELSMKYEEEFDGRDVPRPANWGGWLVRPTEWEFWQGARNRLHDRFVYRRAGDGWTISRLAP
jgi:pyridoxamine 5'-phosphate oxidase